MKISLIFIFINVWFFSLHAQNAEKIYDKINGAVVKILTYKNKVQCGQASGVIIKSKNWVITNYHVLGVADYMTAVHGSSFIDIDSIIAFDAAKDILILRLNLKTINPRVYRSIPNIKIDKKMPKVGQKVYALGSPLGFENTMTDGMISGLRSTSDSLHMIMQISAPISTGSSGGAIVNRKGELVGISAAIIKGQLAQNLNFAVMINDVIELSKGIEFPVKGSAGAQFDYFYRQGKMKCAQGDYVSCLKCFESAAALRVQSNKMGNVRYYMAVAYKATGRADLAKTSFEESIRLAPTAEAHSGLGSELYDGRDIITAMNQYQQALKISPEFSEAILGMGMCYYSLKDHNKAQSHFTRVIKIQPANPKALYMLGQLSMAKKNYESAIYFYRKAIDANHSYKDAYLAISDAYREKGDLVNMQVYINRMKMLRD